MSADTVDDLHAAEDMAGCLAAAIDNLLAIVEHADLGGIADGAIAGARMRSSEWANYCRPTCGAEGDPEVAELTCDDAECCGCPCGHTDVKEN